MIIRPVLLDFDGRLCTGVDTTGSISWGWGWVWTSGSPFSVRLPLPRATVDVESELGPTVDEVESVEETIDCDIESWMEEYESVWAGT